MPTIYEITETALNALNPPVPFAMDSMLDALPDVYIVYFVIVGTAAQHADNEESARTYRVQLSIMSRNDLVNLPDVDAVMLPAGFRKGPERELKKDETTTHYGLAVDYLYLMSKETA